MDAGDVAEAGAACKIPAEPVVLVDVRCQQVEAVTAGALGDGLADVGNVEHGGLHVRIGDEGARLTPPFDKAGADKSGERLADGRPRAAVLGDKFMFERNAVARRPIARRDAGPNQSEVACEQGTALSET